MRADPQHPLTSRALLPLIVLATVALGVAILSRGEPILVPLALTIVLAFALVPVVRALERFRLHRALAVTLTLALVVSAVAALGYVLGTQLGELSKQLPEYTTSMRQKVATLRNRGRGPIENVKQTLNKVTEQLDENPNKIKQAIPVRVVPEDSTSVERLRATLEALLEPAATVLLVLVLLGFFLGKREDLRDRFIRLMGRSRVTLTTRMIDEAANSVSRFLLSQSIVNASFGTVIGLGLFAIGIPYPALWGFLAAVLRFVPYVGAALAMVIPGLLAFAKFPGWKETIETVGLFMAVDALTGYVAEPIFIGRRTGISSVALLLSTVFWTWVWGAKGLVLATPLTVCLASLGRHSRTLRFLDVFLGDNPVLEPDLKFYQRLLARDEEGASKIAEQRHLEAGEIGLLDTLLVPALIRAAADLSSKQISEEEANFVASAIDGILQRIAGVPATDPENSDSSSATLLCIAVRTRFDELLCRMIAAVFDPQGRHTARLSAATLTSETLAEVERRQAQTVLVATLPPTGAAQTKYLCRKLRDRFPQLQIVVLRPACAGDDVKAADLGLGDAGANWVAATVAEAITCLALPPSTPRLPRENAAIEHAPTLSI